MNPYSLINEKVYLIISIIFLGFNSEAKKKIPVPYETVASFGSAYTKVSWL